MIHALRSRLNLFITVILTFSSFHIYSENMQTPDDQTAPIRMELISEENSIVPGRPFWVALHVKMEPNWHAYWKNPGDAGMPITINWKLPEGFHAGTIKWPTPTRFLLSSSVGFGYDRDVILIASITPSANATEGPIELGADVNWLVCSDSSCLPGESQVDLKIAVSSKQPLIDAENGELFKKARAKLPKNHMTFNAQRKGDSIELTFHEPLAALNTTQLIDYFPDQKNTIDYTADPTMQKNAENPSQRTIILKEKTPTPLLKGVLVLHTTKGSHAYHVNTTIATDKAAALEEVEEVAITTPGSQQPEETKQEDLSLAMTSPDPSFDFQGGLLLAIGLAFMGGILLNLMPCVLPVVSFKIMSFMKMAGQNRKLIFKHGVAFTLGVLVSFWVLAAALLSLQAYGRSVGWGFQLQEPIFVAILAALLFLFGLSLFGLFELGTSLISAAGKVQHKSGQNNALIGSFLSGVLATAVATPCTGPFLGTAVGYAVTLPASQALLIFTSLGLGMSLPYLLLSCFPTLLRFLPKPGPWMITFKELMGFFMLASVVWLLWVFSAQTSSLAVSVLLGGFFLLAMAGWVYGKWSTPIRKRMTRIVGAAVACAIFSCGAYVIVWSAYTLGDEQSISKSHTSDTADTWEEFSPERVAELRQKGIPVFIDFTSKWCLICQANHMVLSLDEVETKFAELGVVKMKADWTKRDEIISKELRKFGRNSVPLYVLYGSDTDPTPQILPQVLTPEIILMSLKEVRKTEVVLK